MISHLYQTKQMPQEVQFLYATRMSEPEGRVLFLSRLQAISQSVPPYQLQLTLYVSGLESPSLLVRNSSLMNVRLQQRRINRSDLMDAIGGPQNRASVVCYVCGPPAMTDEFVQVLRQAEGMEEHNVLCEKWW